MYFKDIAGYEEVKSQLIRMVSENHVGHALLFAGADGCGHLPMAVAFAGYVLCQQPGESDRCGACSACRQVGAFSHPDLHFAFPIVLSSKPKKELCADYKREFATELLANPYLMLSEWEKVSAGENKKALIPSGEAEAISRILSLKSFMGGHKVLIIWMAEKMNIQAANKLLKTFEEPAPKTLIILVASNTVDMLPTVVSRTQLMRFEPLDEHVIFRHLVNETGMEPSEAKALALDAEGVYGVALAKAKGEGNQDAYLTLMAEWMRACVQRNAEKALGASEAIASLRKDLQQEFIRYCLEFLHRSLLYTVAGPDNARYDEKAEEFAVKFAPYIVNTDMQALEKVLSNGHYHVERNANALLLFMGMSYQIMRIFHQKKEPALTRTH